jgi:hypothetical protein
MSNHPQIPAGAKRHMEILPLNSDGTMVECVVLKRYNNGDRIFIQVDHLDEIDRERIKKYLSEAHADRFELWDMLSHRRLGNGMNALEYFHQLARYFVAQTRTIRVPNLSVSGSMSSALPGRAIV